MEKLELRVQRCEEDIKELKRYRDECSENNNQTKTELAIAVQKMNDLIETVEKLPENLEKSMLKSIELQEKEHEKIYYDIKELKKDKDKMHDEIAELKKIIDERTIEEDSDNYKKIKMNIALTIIGSILGFVLGLILR